MHRDVRPVQSRGGPVEQQQRDRPSNDSTNVRQGLTQPQREKTEVNKGCNNALGVIVSTFYSAHPIRADFMSDV